MAQGQPRSSLASLATEFAEVVPEVDSKAQHDRWKPGLGPFEEENQLDFLVDALGGHLPGGWTIEQEVEYPDRGQHCDLVLRSDAGTSIPVEAKLLRFRLDNGNIDSNCYMSVFSPFPEETSSSLLTDVQKLVDSEFSHPGGLLGLYYERKDEPYELLEATRLAEKFRLDVEFCP